MSYSIDQINVDKIYDESYGLWISGFFSCISGNYPEITFQNHKDIFFEILSLWLKSGRVYMCSPESPLSGVWVDSPDNIVRSLKDKWPVDAKHEDDLNLNHYFYEIPAIVWIGDNGKIVGS